MTRYPDLEINLQPGADGMYPVELRFRRPDDAGQPALETGTIRVDRAALRHHALDPMAYGRVLSEGLFTDSNIREWFNRARAVVQGLNQSLRVRLHLRTDLPELHDLRWETLRDPQTGNWLLTDEQVLFSRFLSSPDWQPVQLPPRGDLRALVVIANPTDLAGNRYQIDGQTLAPVNVAAALDRAQRGLGGLIQGTIVSDPHNPGPASLNNLVAALREGYDILYLVCHGAMLRRGPHLLLEQADGTADVIPGDLLAQAISDLPPRRRPTLIVLASCQSAGASDTRIDQPDAQTALGPRLVAAGIPVVLAMQGSITVDTVGDFMPEFFRQLRQHGIVDQAMAAARGVVRRRDDAWMPVLFMRLREGCIWEPETDEVPAIPYLRKLHHDAMQSGLLRTLDPSSKDPTQQGQQVTVDQVYTPLDTRMTVIWDDEGQLMWDTRLLGDEMTQDRETKTLSAMEAANHFTRLVILGDPGSGKSTFVNFLALGLTGHLLNPQSDWLNRLRAQGWEHGALLPVLVTLRDFAQDMGDHPGTAHSLLSHIERLLGACGCADAMPAVRDAMSRGRVLLMLDGLDEVPADQRAAVRDTAAAFMNAFPCQVLITCRILSYAAPEWQIPQTESVILAPFDDEKIGHFIEAWYRASSALRLLDDATAQERIQDLTAAVRDRHLLGIAGNPMLLTVMALVHNHQGNLPRETARLYQRCVEILMLKWKPGAARHLRDVLELDDETDLYRILWHIAYEAHEKQGDRDGAADIPKGEVMSIAADDHLDGSYAKAQLFCDYVEDRAGLLVGRGGADGGRRVYAFPHRTFQEFLAGCYIADDVNFEEIIGEKACQGAAWREVVRLATGHMYFTKTDRNRSIAAAQYILAPDPVTYEDWGAVWLAGEMLLVIGTQTLERHRVGRQVLVTARQRLAALVSEGHLEPVERAAAGRTLAELGDPRPGVGLDENGLPDIDWVEIPAGTFLMGSSPEQVEALKREAPDVMHRFFDAEIPQHTVTLDTFYISRYPVTYAQYAPFVDGGGYTNRDYWTGDGWEWKRDRREPELWNDPQWHIANHPVVGMTWYESYAFTRWLSARLGVDVRLPTESEWEKAARGPNGLIYPYGNTFDPARGNTSETGIGQASAVGIFPGGVSPYGVLDMSGNVLEWGLTKWRGRYNEPEDNNPAGTDRRVLRGGAFSLNQLSARSAFRSSIPPFWYYDYIGFRVVVSRPPSL